MDNLPAGRRDPAGPVGEVRGQRAAVPDGRPDVRGRDEIAATQQVADAQRSLLMTQLQQTAAAESAAGGIDAQAEAMAKLTPNARSAPRR